MKNNLFQLYMLIFASCLLPATGFGQEAPAPTFEPTENYRTVDMEGWSVVIHQDLLGEDPEFAEAGRRAQSLLRANLIFIKHRLPAGAVVKLQQITIWLDVNDPVTSCAAYHPSIEWLRNNNVNPDKARCVDIANVQNFLDWTIEQPSMVLHELAHAYHDQFIEDGFGNTRIRTSQELSLADEKYGDVMHANGRMRDHYAATNPMEYFAELTEAYFGTNDFYPFINAELKEYDPRSYELIAEMWGVEK
ncbi:MAG: hypothetical protein AAF402_17350 [Pseudomonadota bacterium]